MSKKENTNLLLKWKKIFHNVINEVNNFSTPTILETFRTSFVIIVICFILSLYFICIGEIIVKLISLFRI